MRSLSIYTFVSMYQAMLIFFSTIIYTYIMMITEFAKYNLYLALIPFILNFMLLGVPGSIAVFFHKNNLLKFKLYLGQIIFYILPISFIIGVVLNLLFSGYISTYFHLNKMTISIVTLLCFFQIMPQLLFIYYQTSHNPKKYLYLNITYMTMNFLSTISAYLIFKSVLSVFIASCIIALIFSLYALNVFRSNYLLIFKFNKIAFVDILSYGTPLIIHTLSMALLFMSDRFFISYFLSDKEVALYSVSLQLSMMILIFVNSFAGAWGAFLFKELKKTNGQIIDRSIIKKIYIICLSFLLLPFFLYYVQQIVLDVFFSVKYQSSINYVLIIGLGYSIMGIYKVFIGFLHYNKATKQISLFTVYAFLINMLLNYILIQKYQTLGVAYSTLISMFFITLFTFVYANKTYNFKWSLK